MKRYQGEHLGDTPQIALISNDAIGNYVVITPILQALKGAYPDGAIHYFGGTRTEEFWVHEPLISEGFALFGTEVWQSLESATEVGAYDLVINVENSMWAKVFTTLIADLNEDTFVAGPCMNPNGRGDYPFPPDDRGALWDDPEWTSKDITTRFPFLNTGFIVEILMRGCYLDMPIPAYKLPRETPPDVFIGQIPDVLIATTASLPSKLWPLENWKECLRALRKTGHTVGLLGAPPKQQAEFWRGADLEDVLVKDGLVTDLRGQYTLPQVVSAIANAKLVFTLDNGILHVAAATSTPIVGIFREGIHRLWAPPVENLTVIHPLEGQPVSSITSAQTIEAVEAALAKASNEVPEDHEES